MTQIAPGHDFVLEVAEIYARLQDLDKKWGRENLRVLLAYRCTFDGRIRSMGDKMKIVDDVLKSLADTAKGMRKPGV